MRGTLRLVALFVLVFGLMVGWARWAQWRADKAARMAAETADERATARPEAVRPEEVEDMAGKETCTFGHEAQEVGWANFVVFQGGQFESCGEGVGLSMTAYVRNTSGADAHAAKAALYDLAGNLVGAAEEVVVPAGWEDWIVFPFALGSRPAIAAATEYVLVVWSSSADLGVACDVAHPTAMAHEDGAVTAYDGWPDPAALVPLFTRYSVLCTVLTGVEEEVEFFLSTNRPEDDVSASGGAVDRKCRVIRCDKCDDLAGGSGDRIDLVSTAAGDTNSVTLAGYKLDGSRVEEIVAMNGAVHVQSANKFLHLRQVEIDADAIGVITVARFNAAAPVELFTIPIGERGASAVFLLAKAEHGGGATMKVLYEKVFGVNVGVVALAGMMAYMPHDEDDEMRFDCEELAGVTVTDGNEEVANRLAEPAGYAWGQHATAGAGHRCGDAEDGELVPGEAQGLWLQCTFAAGRAGEKQVTWAMGWVAE